MKKSQLLRATCALAFSASTALTVGCVQAADEATTQPVAATTDRSLDSRPNILVILTDDQGYATTGAYGANPHYAVTPRMDSLATEGARFTNAYVTASVCSPSRAGLITGRYQQRFGYYANIDGQRGPGLPADETVMARYFKDAGYATAAIGKWHLGTKLPGQHPLDRGFDKYYGFDSAQTDYFSSPILYDGREKVEQHKYLTFQFTDEAISFMDEKKDKPFFMYLAYNAVHGPDQAPPEYRQRMEEKGVEPKERTRAAMLAALDDSIGHLLDAMKQKGLEKNTLVYFLSDNGGLPYWWEGSNAPWRGYKREQWEGGERVQFMMRWPGHIEPGQVRSELTSSLDILPTSLAAAGIEVPAAAKLDGASLLPIFNTKTQQTIHPALYFAGSHWDKPVTGKEKTAEHDNPPPSWAVRRDQWKLMQIMEMGAPKLYDMDKDLGETNDVAAQHPELVKSMTQDFASWFKDMAEPIAWNKKYYDQLKAVK